MQNELHYHRLELTYPEFVNMNKEISNTTIGNYYVYEELGRGAFGQVYKGMDDRTKHPVAIKVLDLRAIKEEPNDKLRQIQMRLCDNEDKMMSRCNSPNLIKCYDVFVNQDLKIIVMEYCNRGTLESHISKRKRIPQKEAISILKQILNGIAELHSHRIVHRDLKSENILLHNSWFKIADFGFSKELKINNDEVIGYHTFLGTMSTMAPELLSRQKYGLKADIWSIGIIFCQMLFGESPFTAASKPEMLAKIKQSGLLKKRKLSFKNVDISPETYDFLKAILVVDQNQRIGWKELVNHPIFKNQSINRISRIIVEDPAVNPPNEDEFDPDEPLSIGHWRQMTQTGKLIKIIKQKIEEKRNEMVQTEQDKAYQFISDRLQECLKAQLIFQEIVSKIQKHKLLNLQKRQVKQLMYLLVTRCYLDLSPINQEIKTFNKNDPSIANICQHIANLYQRLEQSWRYYEQSVRQEEDTVLSMIGDFFTSKQTLNKKNVFMNGIPNQDYSKKQQVQYIQSFCIRPLLKNLQSLEHKRVRDLLLLFKDIMLTEPKVFEARGFDAYIDHLLLNQ